MYLCTSPFTVLNSATENLPVAGFATGENAINDVKGYN